jgi:pimeloyl-ACP methyl ester carboxylesterase
MCNRGFWTPWLARLRERGHAYVAVNLEPPFGPIDACVHVVEDAVRRMTQATGEPPVLVCHSMGGLVARAWLRTTMPQRVRHVVTIGSPHRGTWLGRFSGTASGRQMRLDSDWVRALAADPSAHARFTCWYSDCDNVVFPPSTATLPGADNRFVPGIAHVELAFHPRVMAHAFALVGAGESVIKRTTLSS